MRNIKQQNILNEIGIIIKNLRITRGYSRFQLAVEIGTDEKQIRRIENGETNPTIITLLKVLTALKSDLSIFKYLNINQIDLF